MHRLTRPVGRHSLTKVKRFFEDFEYQAASWDKPRRVITFQLAQVAVTGPMVRAILATIRRFRVPSLNA